MVYVHDETVYLPRKLHGLPCRSCCTGTAEATSGCWNEARVVDEQWEHHKTSSEDQGTKVPPSTVGICWYMLLWYIR